MLDRLGALVGLEVALGDIGHVVAVMHQDVIPGLVLRRFRARHRLVPLLGILEVRIDIDNDAAIVEQPVAERAGLASIAR